MSAALEERESDAARRDALETVLWRAWNTNADVHQGDNWRKLCLAAGLSENVKQPATWIGDIADWMVPRAMEDERIYTRLMLLFG